MGFSTLALLKLLFYFIFNGSIHKYLYIAHKVDKKKNPSSPFLSHKYLNVDIVMINSS